MDNKSELNEKLMELTEDELKRVTGGSETPWGQGIFATGYNGSGNMIHAPTFGSGRYENLASSPQSQGGGQRQR